MFEGKTLMITGGTGSFGNAVLSRFLDTGVLRDLYHADKRDSVAIDNTYQRIFDLKRKMIKSSLDTETEIENLLTPEQTKQFLDRLHQAPPRYPGR